MGQKPWAKVTRPEYLPTLERGERLPQPSACPANVYGLMLSTWEWEADRRPTFAECVLFLQTVNIYANGTVRDLGALLHSK